MNIFASRWDALEEGIKTEQKQLDTQSLQWNSYQDILSQTVAWLDNVEKSVTSESGASLSPQEIRSKLLKLKVSFIMISFLFVSIFMASDSKSLIEKCTNTSLEATHKKLNYIYSNHTFQFHKIFLGEDSSITEEMKYQSLNLKKRREKMM